jgi:rhodanese-related sulfurtransferase
MDRTPLRAVVLLFVSTGAAVFANAVRPRIPWVIDLKGSTNPNENKQLLDEVKISADQFRAYISSGTATIIDARKPEEFAEAHVAGAINIPSTMKEQYIGTVFSRLTPDATIVIYCGGGKCEASAEVFEFLLGTKNFKKENLHIFEDGWEWIGKQTDIPIMHGAE